jgi:pullulanase
MIKKLIFSSFLFLLMLHAIAQTNQNMWLSYHPSYTTFKLFSPDADEAIVKLYQQADDKSSFKTISFTKKEDGNWLATFDGNAENLFYTYQVKYKGVWLNETIDIYATAVAANGKKAQIINWEKQFPKPVASNITPNKNAIVVYELHIRDATIFSNAKHKGKFLGLTEENLKNKYNQAIGLSHIKNLGVTHVQILPMFDFNSIDETSSKPNYNWGYDPLNYNVPEGSYSTNPNNPVTRIKECRAMIEAFHKNGIGVIMDVVYNHTGLTKESNFNQLCPNYYYRTKPDGKFSDASGCGNETASDKPMFKMFMIESLKHWVKWYDVDGFRFDLMAIHDIETMNEIAKELRKIKPNIILYGEGWTAGDSPLPESKRALKKHALQMDGVGVFSDDLRDAIKGSVFNHSENGFIAGIPNVEESIKFGIVGGIEHPQVDYSKVNYSKAPYCNNPLQHVSYNECHDNHTLWDRLTLANPNASEAEKIEMYKVAMGIVMLSQGISFMQAGQEFCRTKFGEENSYNKPDSINGLRWDNLNKYKSVEQWVKKLIALKKGNEAFALGSAALVKKNVQFIEAKNNVVAYTTTNGLKTFLVIINTNTSKKIIEVGVGKKYKTVLSNKPVLIADNITVQGTSFSVLEVL